MTFAVSPPPRGPGLGSSATHSTRAQDPASREKSSPGVHVFTYHPPPGASAKMYLRAAHPAENTGTVSPLPPEACAAPPTPRRRLWLPCGGPVSDARPYVGPVAFGGASAAFPDRPRRHAARLIDIHTVCMLLWV